MSTDEKTTLSFVSEVGTFGSMGIKDTTVVKAELDAVTESYDSAYADNDLEANALRDYLNQNKNRKDENNEF